MKRFAVLLLATFVGAPWLMAQTSPSAGQDDTVVEEIIARINNNIITRADLRRSQEQLKNETSQQPEPAGSPSEAKEREQDLLRDLIDQQLLLQKGEELGISADTDLVKRLDELRKQMHAEVPGGPGEGGSGPGRLLGRLQTEPEEQHHHAARDQPGSGRAHQRVAAGDPAVLRPAQKRHGAAGTGSHERDPDFNSEQGGGQGPRKGRRRCPRLPSPEVVAAAQAKADKVYDLLKKGGKFDELAKQYSDGPTADQDGDLEYFKRGTLSKDLEERVFAMNAGSYSEPVRTNQGWVILKVTEHQTAGVPPLKEVEGRVQEQIYMTKMQPALRDYLTKLREDAYIDIKAGYVDTGASPNETKPIYTTTATEGSSKTKKKKKFGIF